MATRELSRALARRGHEVTILTTSADDCARISEKSTQVNQGVRIVRLPRLADALGRRSRVILWASIRTEMSLLLEACDAVHLQDVRGYHNVIAHALCASHGIPYVVQAHGSLPRHGRLPVLKAMYDVIWGSRVLTDAAYALALTAVERAQYMRRGVSPSRVAMVENGLDLSLFEELPERGHFRQRFGIPQTSSLLLFLGRLHPIKGVDILIRAFKTVLAEMPQTHLSIVGPDGGALRGLQSLVSELGLEHSVQLTGALAEQEKVAAYVDCDLFVLPSRYDTYPLTVLEALACGKPIIVTDACGIAPMMHEFQEPLITSVDASALAATIIGTLRRGSLSSTYVEQMRSKVLTRFAWDRVVCGYERVYAECLGD
jgi:glycosyltransferase involved in cell wall biosynthesis